MDLLLYSFLCLTCGGDQKNLRYDHSNVTLIVQYKKVYEATAELFLSAQACNDHKDANRGSECVIAAKGSTTILLCRSEEIYHPGIYFLNQPRIEAAMWHSLFHRAKHANQ